MRNNIVTQFVYKLHAYSDMFNKLIIFQLIGLLLALLSESSFGSGTQFFDIRANLYSSSLIISATIFWGFIMGAVLAQKQTRAGDFYFVGNRLTVNLSNILFLVTAAVVGSITAILSNSLLKLVLIFLLRKTWAIDMEMQMSSLGWLQGSVGVFLYLILFASLGYWFASILSLSSKVRAIIGVTVFAVFFLLAWFGGFNIFGWITDFYFRESIFIIFFVKVVLTTLVLFVSSTIVSNRQEVRI